MVHSRPGAFKYALSIYYRPGQARSVMHIYMKIDWPQVIHIYNVIISAPAAAAARLFRAIS